jgi:hypothetical protein
MRQTLAVYKTVVNEIDDLNRKLEQMRTESINKPAPPSITTEDKGDTITGKGEH